MRICIFLPTVLISGLCVMTAVDVQQGWAFSSILKTALGREQSSVGAKTLDFNNNGTTVVTKRRVPDSNDKKTRNLNKNETNGSLETGIPNLKDKKTTKPDHNGPTEIIDEEIIEAIEEEIIEVIEEHIVNLDRKEKEEITYLEKDTHEDKKKEPKKDTKDTIKVNSKDNSDGDTKVKSKKKGGGDNKVDSKKDVGSDTSKMETKDKTQTNTSQKNKTTTTNDEKTATRNHTTNTNNWVTEANNRARLVASADISSTVGQELFISDVSNTIFNAIDHRARSSISGASLSQLGFRAIGDPGINFWGTIFGGYRNASASNALGDFRNGYYGLVSGLEIGDPIADGAFGLLGGSANGQISISRSTRRTEISSFFGGAYWKKDYGTHRIHAAFVIGRTENKSKRSINGRTSASEYDGVFYAPSLTVITPLALLETPANISIRASYVNLQLDRYTETGAGLPLVIADRDVSLFNIRNQLNFPQITRQKSGDFLNFNWSIGIDATIDAGSENIGALIGGIPFKRSSVFEDQTTGFVSIDFSHVSADRRRSFGLYGELQSDFGGGIVAVGQLNTSIKF